VDIMEKCKKLWYDKCQEDPDDDPERTGIKWSVCLEGALNYWTNENRLYEERYDVMREDMDELNKEKEELFDKNEELEEKIGLIGAYIHRGENANEIKVFNDIMNK